ncbi:MAG: glutamate-cysteine ligase family protein [Myxococcota bacterium]
MGVLTVKGPEDEEAQRAFTRRVLDDVEALEKMLSGNFFETGLRRVGAEQELFLIDRNYRPAPLVDDVLQSLSHEGFTTELARFNLEYNCKPQVFKGKCLSLLEDDLSSALRSARDAARVHGADILMCGILPTLRQDDLHLGNMTPRVRYHALNDIMTAMRGGAFRIAMKGVDELDITHDNVMLEACNTSFQVHFQAAPHEFAKLYNIAQVVTGPVLAAAVNSPVLLGQRLWAETRVGLFQQSVDDRSSTKLARGSRPRVSFGDRWVDDSVIEIFREDIARFRILIAAPIEEGRPLELVEKGIAPELKALRLHNGTVYRWNRACYGVVDNVAHLRVENRVLPAGPTVLDEVANAAFFFGLMSGFVEEMSNIKDRMSFDDARANFFSAARYGLKAQFHWIDEKRYPASELILKEMLPLARGGLKASGIDDDDAERYLNVIEERVKREQTGAQWLVRSLGEMPKSLQRERRLYAVTASMHRQQNGGSPAHEWSLARAQEEPSEGQVYKTVSQLMTREVVTVQKEDLVDLAASLMDWERLRHIPVEDDHGQLVGLVSHRAILRLVARGSAALTQPVSVSSVMHANPVTVSPDTTLLEAMELMREKRVGCLPVVKDGRLVGLVTERDYLHFTEDLVLRSLRGEL